MDHHASSKGLLHGWRDISGSVPAFHDRYKTGSACTQETFSGDMSSDEYQSQTDGEHFYKSKFGRGELPSYEIS